MPETPEKASETEEHSEEEKKAKFLRRRRLGDKQGEPRTREYFLHDLRRITRRLGGGRFRGGS